MSKSLYKSILSSFIDTFTPLIGGIVGSVAPVVEANIVNQLCQEVQTIFKKTSTMIELESPIVIFGDIHGHVLDMIRLINEVIMNPIYEKFKILFLGDIVDRGEFSVETAIILFILISTQPDRIFCIRGNHEFEDLAKKQGFYSQIMNTYPQEEGITMFNSFICAFDWIPFSATIDSNVICLHGGISPVLYNVEQLKMLPRPYHSFKSNLINDILWSDPREVEGFTDSNRGLGYFFGEEPLKTFLDGNHFDVLVRAHECVNDNDYAHNGRCITVFSASNYCGQVGNKCSILIIASKGERELQTFFPILYLMRDKMIFQKGINHARSSSWTLASGKAAGVTRSLLLTPSKMSNHRRCSKKSINSLLI